VLEPWIAALRRDDVDAAWDEFIGRYRRLICATICHFTRDEDELSDVFARVCEALRARDLARLRHYIDEPSPRARFSTWLVTVVRNQTIDWLRQRKGRPRPAPPATLSPAQRQIYQYVFAEGRSHVEAYEAMRTRTDLKLPFGAFLREVRATYAAVNGRRPDRAIREVVAADSAPVCDAAMAEASADDLACAVDAADWIADALNSLAPEERLAVQLFVVDDMPAADVARSVGWPNAKAVYNRVYRCLAAIRQSLEREGIHRGDL
jgi:RNA polymerase sigma factor (sigma-70 family)